VRYPDPEYITSPHGTRATERLYDATRSLLASTAEPNSKWAQDVRSLLDHTDAFAYGLRSDRTTTRFVQALDLLLADTRTLAQDTVTAGTVAQRRRREELVDDVFGWFVPLVLRSLRAIPMPRVEFQNDVLDLAATGSFSCS
jgi:hypothetical protein